MTTTELKLEIVSLYTNLSGEPVGKANQISATVNGREVYGFGSTVESMIDDLNADILHLLDDNRAKAEIVNWDGSSLSLKFSHPRDFELPAYF